MGAGEQGVVLRFGAVQERVLDEGMYFIIPFVEDVILMDVKIPDIRDQSGGLVERPADGFVGDRVELPRR